MTAFPRRIRLVVLLAACALLLPPAFTARGDDASKQALIDEIFEATHTDALMQQRISQGLEMQKAQTAKLGLPESAKEIQEKWAELYAGRLSWTKLKPEMSKIYAENFSEEELSSMLAFYKSPAGQAVITKMPAVMAGSMGLMQRLMAEMAPEMKRIMEEVAAKHGEAAPGATKP